MPRKCSKCLADALYQMELEKLNGVAVSRMLFCEEHAAELDDEEAGRLQLIEVAPEPDGVERLLDADEVNKLIGVLRIVMLRYNAALAHGFTRRTARERDRTLQAFGVSCPEFLELVDELGLRGELERLGIIELLKARVR